MRVKKYKFEIFTSLIEQNILEGIYKAGQKLPSVRELKQQYQISTSTIQSGYEHLIISGTVTSVPKSGYYVAARPQLETQQPADKHPPVVRDAIFKHHVEVISSLRAGRRVSEFNVAAPGDLLIPQKLLLRTMQQTIREHGAGLLRYYPRMALPNFEATLSSAQRFIKRSSVQMSC